MPIVLAIAETASPPQYTDVEIVRTDPRVTDEITDEEILAAIQLASLLIDSIIPGGFPEAVTESRKFFDIRSWPLVIRGPISDVTSIAIDGHIADSNSYELTNYGVIFRPDVYSFANFSGLTPRHQTHVSDIPGVTVMVTATWGYDETPYAVSQAIKLMAIDQLLSGGIGGGVDLSMLDSRVQSLSVEAFSVSLRDESSVSDSWTTGNSLADRLLQQYRTDKIGIL